MKICLRVIGSFVLSALMWSLFFRSSAVAFTLMGLLAIHELGHYLAAKYKNIDVSVPLFTPFGAFINLRKMPNNAHDEAFMAMAGPLFGIVASFAAIFGGFAIHQTFMIQAGFLGLGLNLFNLIPLSPLDGGRIAMGISRRMWIVGLLAYGVVLAYSGLSLYNLLISAYILFAAFSDIKLRAHLSANQPQYFKTPLHERMFILGVYLSMIVIDSWALWVLLR